ncbi:MAG TPA: hypothetical protein PK006_11005 [Saprospiraceae bacterium]|nr:hypothetical protein [Saprospiraceae bacterium]
MTLAQFFEWIQLNAHFGILYFIAIPLIALLAGWFAKEEGHLSPWRYLYSLLIYAICIPGIFALTLNIYLFFWERRSIMNTDLIIQVLPIVSMIATIAIIKNNVNLDDIPGFEKISGLALIIAVILTLMWILDRTHIYAISFMPFPMVIGIIVGGVLLLRMLFKKWI